jgi:hypothetical protein
MHHCPASSTVNQLATRNTSSKGPGRSTVRARGGAHPSAIGKRPGTTRREDPITTATTSAADSTTTSAEPECDVADVRSLLPSASSAPATATSSTWSSPDCPRTAVPALPGPGHRALACHPAQPDRAERSNTRCAGGLHPGPSDRRRADHRPRRRARGVAVEVVDRWQRSARTAARCGPRSGHPVADVKGRPT